MWFTCLSPLLDLLIFEDKESGAENARFPKYLFFHSPVVSEPPLFDSVCGRGPFQAGMVILLCNDM